MDEKQIPEKFLKPYNPSETEDRIYQEWEKGGYFTPEKINADSKETFSMVLPPPNVTGALHMGSALMLAIEDIMARYARLKGQKTLWIPGTDHAAIATQAVVEKEIQKKEGKSRHDLGREELLKRINEHAASTHDRIVNQMRKLGASLDWSREAFTLDEKRSLAVRTTFKKMYDDGRLARKYRVVNWDPKGQTTISDDEIEYETRKTKLYTFKYSRDIPLTISTTRPETKLGDTAIAVHPDDKRYQKFIGQEFKTIFAGEEITLRVIADKAVDPEFGTGALGVTPAHSMIDWEMAYRQTPPLPIKQVIDEFAKMTVGMEGVKGKKVAEAREAVVAWLKREDLLEKEEEIEHNIALAQRTGGVIEPLPKLQWFVLVDAFREKMKQVVTAGKIKIIPDRFEKIYFHWIDNLRDWCISRQIWYGHRIPVWYKGEEIYVDIEPPKGDGWIQDEDTLDTWFSSGLWTFSTLGWPDEKEFAANRQYHPTTVLETGSDILFFWVARMILMSTYLLDEVPFKTVYLHGLVRDTKGRKISKSLGNNIDPIDMITKYGADAVRMSLIVGVGPGNDSKIDEQKIKAYKHFANKIWNVTRFVVTNCPTETWQQPAPPHPYLEELDKLTADITLDMDNFRYYLAAEKLYHYVWHTLADKIIEEAKKDPGVQTLLPQILTTCLKLLHPFMPFITEEIWSLLPHQEIKKPLIAASWPK